MTSPCVLTDSSMHSKDKLCVPIPRSVVISPVFLRKMTFREKQKAFEEEEKSPILHVLTRHRVERTGLSAGVQA